VAGILRLFVLILLLPGLALAQSQTLPADAGAWNEHLEIGPLGDLITTWHLAPRFTAAPEGETARFRIRASRSSRVTWSGAREVERTNAHSIAEVPLVLLTGPLTVAVSVETAQGELIEEAVVLDVRNQGPLPLRVTGIRVTASPVEIDPRNPNASTMRYYFQGASIAALRELAPDHYLTSIDRWLTLEAEVEPPAFAPLVEWRLDGEPQRHLGGSIRMRVFTGRSNTIEAGPKAASVEVALDTYIVRITSPRRGDEIPDGAPVTFTAVTDPPGYEDQITWLASTKYGSCDPLMGEGPEFTTMFFGTSGEEGRWLGARADNAIVGADQKGGVPTPDLNPWFSATTCAFALDEEIDDPVLSAALLRYCDPEPPVTSTSVVIQRELSTGDFVGTCDGGDLLACEILAEFCTLHGGRGYCSTDGKCYCFIDEAVGPIGGLP